MKTNRRSSNREPRGGKNSSAVVVVVILVGIMTSLVVANSRTLYYLHRDMRLTEQNQQRKFEKALPAPPPATPPATNQVEKPK